MFHLAIWLPLVVWIFVTWMVWQKKIFYDQMELKYTARGSRWLKAFLLVGGISYGLWWICAIYSHPRLGWEILSEESPLPYIIGLLCALGSIGFLVMSIRYIIKRRKKA